jgi:hypothetical protein
MAYKLIWSPAARDDLHDIVAFIANDDPNRAKRLENPVPGLSKRSMTALRANYGSIFDTLAQNL